MLSKANLTTTTIDRLTEVIGLIAHEPEDFDMKQWEQTFYVWPRSAKQEGAQPCRTSHCIGGYAVMLHNRSAEPYDRLTMDDVGARAALPLADRQPTPFRRRGCSPSEWEPTVHERLFYMGMWPLEFRRRYNGARTVVEMSQAAIDRIEHWIATDGLE